MSNMSYCRWHNTLQDLEDCAEHIEDELSSDTEISARKRLIKLAFSIASDFMDEDGNLDNEMIEDLQPAEVANFINPGPRGIA